MRKMGKKEVLLCIKNNVSTALPFILITVLILIPVGIAFMSLSNTVDINEQIEDYTDCFIITLEGEKNNTCIQYMGATNISSCECLHTFNINTDMKGDINVFYELETFNQLKSDYVNSRDDNQLMGILNDMPSANCEPYRYVETEEGKIPIAPCGAIADSMFTDQFILRDGLDIVPFLYSGILSDYDKVGYQNPPGNWTAAVQKFGKPKRWAQNIWELDISDHDNNGFQNEQFIGWMKTELKRKPYARIDKKFPYADGLHSGQYSLRISYRYPITLYDGRRKFILSASQKIWSPTFFIIGLTSVIVGTVLLLITTILFIMRKRIRAKEEVSNNLDPANECLRNNRETTNF